MEVINGYITAFNALLLHSRKTIQAASDISTPMFEQQSLPGSTIDVDGVFQLVNKQLDDAANTLKSNILELRALNEYLLRDPSNRLILNIVVTELQDAIDSLLDKTGRTCRVDPVDRRLLTSPPIYLSLSFSLLTLTHSRSLYILFVTFSMLMYSS